MDLYGEKPAGEGRKACGVEEGCKGERVLPLRNRKSHRLCWWASAEEVGLSGYCCRKPVQVKAAQMAFKGIEACMGFGIGWCRM